MKKQIILILTTLMFSGNSNATSDRAWNDYEQLAEKIEVTATNAPIKKLNTQSIELITLAKKLLPELMRSQAV